nr:dihydrofolate reductase [uncultured bacterium]
MAKVHISAIAAVAKNNVIGRDNKLIWHIPEDMRHFKATTMGKPIVMGRKSYESLGKPLPGRVNIVISRSGGKVVNENGPFFFTSIDEALADANKRAEKSGAGEIMIIGGGEIYKQTLPITDRIYLTRVEKDYEGDTFFPDLNPHEWHTVSKEHHDGDPPFTFYLLERK